MKRYREKRIRSLRELRMVIEALELDEGVRIHASFEDLAGGGFIFVTKSGGLYCVNVCERVFDEASGRHLPGGREAWHQASNSNEVWGVIKDHIKSPVEAWLY